MNWKKFADDVVNNKASPKSSIIGSANPYMTLTKRILEEEALAKEHFAVSKSSLVEIMEEAYFPLIDVQEHNELYQRLDMAIKM